MRELITLQANSPEFKSYLEGSFSREKRALPVQSVHVNTNAETVTFEIVPVNDIKKPGMCLFLSKTLKLNGLLLVLFPIFFVLAKNSLDRQVRDPVSLIFATMGILFLYLGFSLRNDYGDHMLGLDRINPHLGSQSIQKGWITARTAKRWANIFVSVAFLSGLPVFIAFPQIFLFLLLTLIIGYLAFFSKSLSIRQWEGSEAVLMLLLGPMLTCGFEVAITGFCRRDTFALGILWGWLSLFPIHLKNLEHILSFTQAGLSNLVTAKGFDGGKKLVRWWWWVGFFGFLVYHYLYAGTFWFWFYGLFLGFVSLRFTIKLSNVDSPMGSEMAEVRKDGVYMFLLLNSLWFFEFFWELFQLWKD